MKKIQLTTFFAAIVLLMMSAVSLAQDSAATAASVRGEAMVTDANGESRRLQRGGEVHAGDSISTSERSRVRLSFTDGSTFVLLAETQFKINDYHFPGQEDGTERAELSIQRGALEVISGLIGKSNKKAFRLDTPFATIGLRGTQFVVFVSPTGHVVITTISGTVILTSKDIPNGQIIAAGNQIRALANGEVIRQQVQEAHFTTLNVDGSDNNEVLNDYLPETEGGNQNNTDANVTAPLNVDGQGSTVDVEAIDNIITTLSTNDLSDEELIALATQLIAQAEESDQDVEAVYDEIVTATLDAVNSNTDDTLNSQDVLDAMNGQSCQYDVSCAFPETQGCCIQL